MDDFEYLLEKEISESLMKHPELWSNSIMGLKRTDGLDLRLSIFESISDVSIYSPYKYAFKDEKIRKRLWRNATNVVDSIANKKKIDENKVEDENKNKLSVFLNLDSRKNKLKKLNELSLKKPAKLNLEKPTETNSEKLSESNSEKSTESFFQKLINKLKI